MSNAFLVAQLVVMILPWPVRRRLLNLRSGWAIAPTARIGMSLIGANMVRLDEGARIGHLNMVRNLTTLSMEERSRIGNLNWITGYSGNRHFVTNAGRSSALRLGREAAVTHRHLIDCTDSVTIGAYSIVAGWGSQILTHGIDFTHNRQSAAPVTIGDYSFVGTRAILLKGSSLPSYSILSAGSVLSSHYTQEHSLYGGCPAGLLKQLTTGKAYFSRQAGFVA